MPTKEFYLERIEKEFATAREALKSGNDGKARVCTRRAAGEAIAWFLTKYPRSDWAPDAIRRLESLNNDPFFPVEARDAAHRLTVKISDQFTYPFTTNPIEDAEIIIRCITLLMEHDAG